MIDQKIEKVKRKFAIKAGLLLAKLLGSLFTMLLIIMMFASVAGKQSMVPNLEDDQMVNYRKVADHCGINWEEFLAYLIVKYENDFEGVEAEQVALDFIIINYVEESDHREVEDERQEVGERVVLESKDEIVNDAERRGYTGEVKATQIVDFYRSLTGHKITIESKEVYDFMNQFDANQLEWYTALVSDNLLREAIGEQETFDLPESLVVNTRGFFAYPAPGIPMNSRRYGMEFHPIFEVWKQHTGVDISAAGCYGKPVIAAAKGIVARTSHKSTGYGLCVLIEHVDKDGHRWQTRYAHLAELKVTEGQEVERGTVIGAIGSTGDSTGPHLHFEVMYQGTFVDPEPLIN